MADTFLLNLDTTAPAVTLNINAGAPATDQTDVTLNFAFDADAFEIKIWGDIDPTDPVNADYGEVEADTDWIPIEAAFAARLLPGDGTKTIRFRVRDEVWNESGVLTDTIILGAIPVEDQPAPARQVPPRKARIVPEVKTFPASELHPKVSYRTEVVQREESAVSVEERAMVAVRTAIRPADELAVQVSTEVASYQRAHLGVGLVSHDVVHKRPEGPGVEEALTVLDII